MMTTTASALGRIDAVLDGHTEHRQVVLDRIAALQRRFTNVVADLSLEAPRSVTVDDDNGIVQLRFDVARFERLINRLEDIAGTWA